MDAEIIIIVVAVALSILSGINKNKKKKQQQTARAEYHEPLPEQDDDPWSTIRRYMDEGRSGYEPEMEGSDNNLYSARQASQEVARGREQSFTDRLKDYTDRKKKYTGERKENSSLPEAEPHSLPEDIMEDFDLEKAVIYSEILKPKFDEY